jgi:hypothetical protein
MKEFSPSFEIVTKLDGFDLCNSLVAIPGSIVRRDAQKYRIELDKPGQEEICIKAILENLKKNSDIPGQLIWIKDGRILKYNFNSNHLFIFKTLKEKRFLLAEFTGTAYDERSKEYIIPVATNEELAALFLFYYFIHLENQKMIKPGFIVDDNINTKETIAVSITDTDEVINTRKLVAKLEKENEDKAAALTNVIKVINDDSFEDANAINYRLNRKINLSKDPYNASYNNDSGWSDV